MDLEVDTDSAARSGKHTAELVVFALAAASFIGVLIANISGISIGDDGVGYQAIADSLAHGDGYGYFLERPVTVWPPVWSALMALVSRITPLGTVGAAVLLNAIVSACVVLLGYRLLKRLIVNERIILLATIVLALGPATIGLGHVLMTDMAFALVVMAWMLILMRFWDDGTLRDLIFAGMLAWLGFGIRYVGLVLIGIGGLWILLDNRKALVERIRNGMLYGAVSVIAPVGWMLRNYGIDKTFTGERHTSARGFVDNGFDLAATIGRFLLPGVANEATKIWAAIGVAATILALIALWSVLSRRQQTGGEQKSAVVHRGAELLGTPIGLVGMFACLYLAYMLYVRTTTALNQLDLRLLFPAYFPLMIVILAVLDRLSRRGDTGLARISYTAVHIWAALNLIAGIVAMIAFGMGHPYFKGDYASDTFVAVRSNPALDALPSNCRNFSNLPNALYPVVGAHWSPQRTALESTDPVNDLSRIERSSARVDTCLIWVDEQPVYGHLWSLNQLKDHLELTELSSHGPVTVYRVRPPAH